MAKLSNTKHSDVDIVMWAEYYVANVTTIRKTAERFKTSKSTIHTAMKKRLREIDSELYSQVLEVLEKNKAERCYRGGSALAAKYAKNAKMKE